MRNRVISRILGNLEPKFILGKLLGRRRITSHALIEKEGKFLLGQEATGRVVGLWGFPGGGVKTGEASEKSAVRETKEEVGYDISIIRKIGTYKDNKRASIRIVYLANITGGDLKVDNDEIMDVKWFSKEEILNMKDKLRGDWILKAIDDK